MFPHHSRLPKATNTRRLGLLPFRANRKGLSLIELLVAISVLGFLSAIAIPIVSNVFNKASKSAAQQTAKQIAQAAVSATATGNTEIMDSNTLDEAIEAVIDGLEITIGQETSTYDLGLINDSHLQDAKEFLGWQDGVIIFCPQGVPHQNGASNALAAPAYAQSVMSRPATQPAPSAK